ncbi:hypothetical protein Tcan_02475 [Toxocara canis]|uniref:Uncharacterized protein n=1 Tax=Toxocara canis TaxID=6265 RepID=A0A0B2UNR6_TOXCA|nr:hypothetical protein Tcan_02475 [Toxocara canis]
MDIILGFLGEKRRSLQGSAVASASSLITQVKKGSVNGNSGVNGNAGANDSYTVDDSDTAESMPMDADLATVAYRLQWGA